MSSNTTQEPTWWESIAKAQSSIESLSLILGPLPPSLSSSENPCSALLNDPDLGHKISSHLRQPNSGSGNDSLCRWLYDTFQSSDPNLQLTVLRYMPIIAGVYLSRAILQKPLAGFEAVLLALYAHETKARGGQPLMVNIPNLSQPSLYHETMTPTKNSAAPLNLAVLSPTLEPHGTVRSTRRARIVGVALELYYSKISLMPIRSKVDFCEFCVAWAGQDGDMYIEEKKSSSEISEDLNGLNIEDRSNSEVSDDVGNGGEEGFGEECEKGRRIPLPWELWQPILRILGHCLMGSSNAKGLKDVGYAACRSLYARAMHDVNPQAILATGSLLNLVKRMIESIDQLSDSSILSDLQPSDSLVISTI